MLLVKTYIDISPIDGIGLFANNDIPIETVIWKKNELDLVLNKEQIRELPSIAIDYICKYSISFKELNNIILCFDDYKFVNHSNNPNVKFVNDEFISIREILSGEEITINYFEVDNLADYKLMYKLF